SDPRHAGGDEVDRGRDRASALKRAVSRCRGGTVRDRPSGAAKGLQHPLRGLRRLSQIGHFRLLVAGTAQDRKKPVEQTIVTGLGRLQGRLLAVIAGNERGIHGSHAAGTLGWALGITCHSRVPVAQPRLYLRRPREQPAKLRVLTRLLGYA